MPRRLDPKKGLPGLFAPGRPKATEMAFLVEAPRAPVAAAAVEAEPKKARKPRTRRAAPEAPVPVAAPAPAPVAIPAPAPVPAPVPAPAPVPDYLRLAPAFRTVPMLPEPPAPLRLAELPALAACAIGWLSSVLRTER